MADHGGGAKRKRALHIDNDDVRRFGSEPDIHVVTSLPLPFAPPPRRRPLQQQPLRGGGVGVVGGVVEGGVVGGGNVGGGGVRSVGGAGDDDTATHLTVDMQDSTLEGSLQRGGGGSRMFAGSALVRPAASELPNFEDVEHELHALERIVGGSEAAASPPVPPPPSSTLLANGAEAALPLLHDAVKTAVTDAVTRVLQHAPDTSDTPPTPPTPPTQPNTPPSELHLRAMLEQARAAVAPTLLTPAAEDAAARTFAALHPAGRNLLRALGDVRLKATEYAAAFRADEAAARAHGSARVWESARWSAEDAYRRTRALQARHASWLRAADASQAVHWETLRAAARELGDAWARVAERYATMLRAACGADTAALELEVARYLAAAPAADDADVAASATAALEAVRRAVAHFLEAWPARDTQLRSASIGVGVGGVGVGSGDDGALAALRARLNDVEARVAAARRRIVDAQKAQLAALETEGLRGGGGGGGGGGTEGLVSALSAAAAAQTASDAEIDALYAERKDVKEKLEAAAARMAAHVASRRGVAASMMLRTHARWRDAARRAATDVAALEADAATLRLHATHMRTALDAELAAEHRRILTQGQEAYAACVAANDADVGAALGALAAARATVLTPLEASETVLGNELTALAASNALLPQPAIRMVDSAIRTAAAERMAVADVAALHTSAAAVAPIADGLAAGLPSIA